MNRPMRRWLQLSEAARLVEMISENGSPSAFKQAIARGDLDGVRTKRFGSERRWCAEALWRWHLTGSTEGCWELEDIQAFVADYPLPDEAGAA